VSAASKSGPDFIVIGAQRSGTTWLHRVLEGHPSIWVPPIKELHYFDDPANKRYFAHLRERLLRGLVGRRILSTWDLRYFLGRRNDDWYRSLFEPGRRRGKVTGEATPAYAILGADAFEHIKAVNPNVRLIFIMRDPVERMWSAAVNQAINKRGGGDVRLKQKPDSRAVKKSSYLATIHLLEQHFRPDQVFYGFFDDIKQRPAALVTDVLNFLGVEPGNVERLLPKHALNIAAGSKKPPADYELAMAAAHLPWLRDMCQRFTGAPEKWRDRYVALLRPTSVEAPEAARADLEAAR
jgi:hypothetical protein